MDGKKTLGNREFFLLLVFLGEISSPLVGKTSDLFIL